MKHDYLTYARAARAAGVDACDFERASRAAMPEHILSYYLDGGSLAQQDAYYQWLTARLESRS